STPSTGNSTSPNGENEAWIGAHSSLSGCSSSSTFGQLGSMRSGLTDLPTVSSTSARRRPRSPERLLGGKTTVEAMPGTSLLEWLRARDDAALATLLRLRPDLGVPPPPDLTVLATRVGIRASVARACE